MTSRLSWHLGHLDTLRGLAVLGVILVHTAGINGYMDSKMGHTAGMIAFSGQRGVQLFFTVSAFTLFLSAGRRKEKSATRNFFLRRFFRLAPMFYIGIVVTQLVMRPHATPLHILLAMCFLNGFSPSTISVGTAGGWSIADEAIFYLTLPLLFRWITTCAAR